MGQSQRQDNSTYGNKRGFQQELPDDLGSLSANHSAHPHLSTPMDRYGCGKVDEIQTGNQKDEKPDSRKDQDVGSVS